MAETKHKTQNHTNLLKSDSAISIEGTDDPSARGRIMDAALKLFVSQGLAGTSTREIAKASGLNMSLISYYFGGKEGLYKAVLMNFAESSGKQMEKFLSEYHGETMTKDRFAKLMYKLISMIIQVKQAHPSISILLQREVGSGLPYARDIMEGQFQVMLDKMAGFYIDGQDLGYIRKDINPYVVFLSLVQTTDMYMQTSRCGGKIMEKIYVLPEQTKEYTDDIYKIFVEGVMI